MTKVLVRVPALFDAEVVRRLPDGRILVDLQPRRIAVETEDVDPSPDRQCEALARWVAVYAGPNPDLA